MSFNNLITTAHHPHTNTGVQGPDAVPLQEDARAGADPGVPPHQALLLRRYAG